MIGYRFALVLLLTRIGIDALAGLFELANGTYTGPRARHAWRTLGDVVTTAWVAVSLALVLT